MQGIFKHNTFLLIFLLTVVGGFFRFYSLNWGAPYYFHPDERNIASSVSQLHFPDLNPHFFAYGSLPIYAIYKAGVLSNLLTQTSDPYAVQFEQAILISRLFSASFSVLLIPLIFFLGKSLKDTRTGVLAAFFATSSVGLLQFAHFGTFELWLDFFTTVLFLLCNKLLSKPHLQTFIAASVILGVLIATKISSLVLLPLPLLALFLGYKNTKSHRLLALIIFLFFRIFLMLLILLLIFFITNPFVYFDFSAFKGTLHYESTVALGTQLVFYTGEFFNTIPVLFQFIHVYPFLINPILTIVFLPSLILVIYKSVQTKNTALFLLLLFFCVTFFSQAVLFVKWTRYIIPTLPFAYLILAYSITDVFDRFSLHKKTQTILITCLVCISTIFAFSYIKTVLISKDSRIQAAQWLKKSVLPHDRIVSEVYDLGITAFHDAIPPTSIELVNMYDLDAPKNPLSKTVVEEQLDSSQYVILPSQRIFKSRMLHKALFPKGNKFYSDLFSEKLGYEKIYQTPCDLFCTILFLGDPVWRFEQTANVFDRPTVFIFKNMRE